MALNGEISARKIQALVGLLRWYYLLNLNHFQIRNQSDLPKSVTTDSRWESVKEKVSEGGTLH